MRNGRANFASISAAQHDELIYNRQNHKEDKDIYASGKQEVQPVDGRDDKLCAYLWALLDDQDIDNSVNQSGKPGGEEIDNALSQSKGHGNYEPNGRLHAGEEQHDDEFLQA